MRAQADLQPVLNAIAETAARICEANDALIFRVEGDLLRLVPRGIDLLSNIALPVEERHADHRHPEIGR